MVAIGSVIKARVIRIEHYGIYLKHGQEDVLVLVPEVSWEKTPDLRVAFQTGDEIDLVVLRYNYQKRVIVGSIKRLHPEQNPYRELSLLEPGKILHGTVATIYDDAVQVRFPNGAWGHIPKNRLDRCLQVGGSVPVVITDLDVDGGVLSLDLAPQQIEETVTAMSGNES